MVDVLKAMHETDKQVIAMVAPAIIGQFGGTVNNLVGALKAAGFDDVIEVAVAPTSPPKTKRPNLSNAWKKAKNS